MKNDIGRWKMEDGRWKMEDGRWMGLVCRSMRVALVCGDVGNLTLTVYPSMS
ncbi:MAG: hypothetical protein R3275_05010 [Saprospiraceae bacterium]|nr:hypothetical protein [Saprospiraceae bacterium]